MRSFAVIGSRIFNDFEKFQMVMDRYRNEMSEIVSGGARGADTLAAEYARKHGIKITEFLPDYAKYGRGATLKRNHTIIEHADCVIAFIAGESRGTRYTVGLANKKGKEVILIK